MRILNGHVPSDKPRADVHFPSLILGRSSRFCWPILSSYTAVELEMSSNNASHGTV